MPDPYRPGEPGEDPAFYPDETTPRPRRRDQGRRDPDTRDQGRRDAGRRDAGRRDPEPYDRSRRDPDTRDRGRPDRVLPDSGTRDRSRRNRALPDRALPDPDTRDRSRRDRSLPGPDTRDRGLRDLGPDTQDWGLRDPALRDPAPRDPALRGPGRPDHAGRPDPRSRDWGQVKPGQHGPRQRGPRQSGARRAATGRRRQSSPARSSSWRWAEMPGGRGTLIVLAAAALGAGVTMAMHHDPGYLLGGAVIVGTFVAALAVRPKAVYQLIPVPALAYLVGALAAGLIHQQSGGPSRSGLTVNAAQWVAGGFIAMAAGTAVAVAITVIRWLMNRHAAPPGQSPEPEPLAPDRPMSRIVTPSGPVTDSWRQPRPQPASAPGPEPPSWPWPEEPVPQGKRASRREPPPQTEPFSRPRSSSWPEPPARPGPPSFGTHPT